MDLGVGSFVFSLGLVSALPLLRQALMLPPTGATVPSAGRDKAPLQPSSVGTILTSLRKSLPVIALGMVRVVMVKGVEYPVRRFALPLEGPSALTPSFTEPHVRAGTRDGIRRPLELLFHSRAPARPRRRTRAGLLRAGDRDRGRRDATGQAEHACDRVGRRGR